VLAVFGELTITADKGFGHTFEHGGIVLVARVEMGKQRHMEIGADQKGEAEDTKVHAFAFGVAPLGQFGLGLGVDKGFEIGGIKQQGTQIDPEMLDQSLDKGLFDPGDDRSIQVRHVIPETLAGQKDLGSGQETMEDRFSIPPVEGSLAGGPHTAVQCCQEHILTTGEPLLPFGQMAVDGGDNLQFFSNIVQSCQSTELEDLGLQRLCRLLVQAAQQCFCGSQVHKDDRPRFTIDSSRFDDLPVGVTAGDFLLDGGHYYQCIQMGHALSRKIFSSVIVTPMWKSEGQPNNMYHVINGSKCDIPKPKKIVRFGE